ncbi:MAG TPA: dTMP kinase [Bacteroidales bacterium]|jgi:dTMP kinase|nr:dTMP kinase [Bacteroidales bacterium]
MSFIVIEGLDGAGKSTQLKLVEDYLNKKGIICEALHFPRTDSPYFGELVSRFLRGELGSLKEVDPYIVALLYAGDRMDASGMLRSWIESGKTVLLDRYVYSNVAFQCAKLNTIEEQDTLRDWIYGLEFDYFNIPKPDLSIFLDVPFEFTVSMLTNNRSGNDRDYLKGTTDIHEEDLSFQERVRRVYLRQEGVDDNFKVVSCSNNKREMAQPQEIFQRILSVLNEHLQL